MTPKEADLSGVFSAISKGEWVSLQSLEIYAQTADYSDPDFWSTTSRVLDRIRPEDRYAAAMAIHKQAPPGHAVPSRVQNTGIRALRG